MELPVHRIMKMFDFLSRKVCFTFAVCIFSTFGAIAAVPAAVMIWATVPYNTPSDFYRDVILCTILIVFAAFAHYLFFGLFRVRRKRWEFGDVRTLNDHVNGSMLMPGIPTPTLKTISSLLDRLPGKNFRMAMVLSVLVVIVGTAHRYFSSGKLLDTAHFFRGGVIAWITYITFTYIITELITADLRREARLALADRNEWEGTQHSTTLLIKFTFIIILMVTSMLITHGITTSPVIQSRAKAVVFFVILNLSVGILMCLLVFKSILITLREIESTATQLSDEQRARFISGSIDREFINTSTGLYHAALKIIKYRDELQNLNANLEQKVRERTEQIEILSRTDPLTGCFNRGYLIEELPQEIKKALRYGRPFSLIICDLDHFKKVNDTYGHQGGDLVLKEFIQCVWGEYRNHVDWVARYGGEEFIVALPETDVDGAFTLAERIRKSVAKKDIVSGAHEIHVTVSFGVAGFGIGAPPEKITVENLIREADRCLYRAKEAGRNRGILCRL